MSGFGPPFRFLGASASAEVVDAIVVVSPGTGVVPPCSTGTGVVATVGSVVGIVGVVVVGGNVGGMVISS